jgi:hypothetical protein
VSLVVEIAEDALPVNVLLAVGAVLVDGHLVVAFLAVIGAVNFIDAVTVLLPLPVLVYHAGPPFPRS